MAAMVIEFNLDDYCDVNVIGRVERDPYIYIYISMMRIYMTEREGGKRERSGV